MPLIFDNSKGLKMKKQLLYSILPSLLFLCFFSQSTPAMPVWVLVFGQVADVQIQCGGKGSNCWVQTNVPDPPTPPYPGGPISTWDGTNPFVSADTSTEIQIGTDLYENCVFDSVSCDFPVSAIYYSKTGRDVTAQAESMFPDSYWYEEEDDY
jgi:hypothetical protein